MIIIEKFLSLYRAFNWIIWILINKRKFKQLGQKSFINKPLSIKGHRYISMGNKVLINYKSSIIVAPRTGFDNPILEIHDGTIIGNFNHIYATKKIIIGKKVLTADKVYVSDNLHSFKDINVPIMDQPIKQNGEVIIGDGTWIGENVCILGVTIGKNCVIGANAVVTQDIPDYSVAVGIPARIIKRFNHDSKSWEATDTQGVFSNIKTEKEGL